ncbi:farnesol dehydrogenase-like [Belonocnema kinseyi]|uniref:farnesol dehydrogenase-like n=1 Tax=Belonocnema kinseyi TaxID=2817044 RepID=UPI00143D767A|nr:farnesol dehydrogenase-like [Belonocnema kinseyi]
MSSISPACVHTNLLKRTISDPNIEKEISKMIGLEAEDIANSAVYVLSTPPRVQVTELTIKALGSLQ